jgi:hypothetical protein
MKEGKKLRSPPNQKQLHLSPRSLVTTASMMEGGGGVPFIEKILKRITEERLLIETSLNVVINESRGSPPPSPGEKGRNETLSSLDHGEEGSRNAGTSRAVVISSPPQPPPPSQSTSKLTREQAKWKQLFVDFFVTLDHPPGGSNNRGFDGDHDGNGSPERSKRNSVAREEPSYPLMTTTTTTDLDDPNNNDNNNRTMMSTKLRNYVPNELMVGNRDEPRWCRKFSRGESNRTILYFVCHEEATAAKGEGEEEKGEEAAAHIDEMTTDGTSGTEKIHGKLFARLRDGFTMESIDENLVNWKETLYLNLICSLGGKMKLAIGDDVVDYMADSAIVLENSWTERIQPSPCIGKLLDEDSRDNCLITYPLICFAVADYETKLTNVMITSDQYLCIELSVCLPSVDTVVRERLVSVFLGAVDFDTLLERYILQITDFTKKRRFWKSQDDQKKNHVKFINMSGPKKKGMAQVAVVANPQDSTDNEQLPKNNGTIMKSGRGNSTSNTSTRRNDHHGYDASDVGDKKKKKGTKKSRRYPSLLWKSLKLLWTMTDIEKPDRLYCYVRYICVPWTGIMEDIERFLGSSEFSTAFITTS